MSVLAEIIDGVKADLDRRRRLIDIADLRAQAAAAPPPRNGVAALRVGDVRLIAEIKRRSPSKGALADIADPGALARSYAAGGAAAVSVLTEARRFGGSLDDLVRVREAVDLPILRKDFIVDEYQLVEARAAGADIVLLIVAALTPERLREFFTQAGELGLTALVEAHDATEVERALQIGADVIGVNTRDLRTLRVDPGVFAPLAALIPPNVVTVAESGVRDERDVAAYGAAGADAVLVGEALVSGGDPQAAVRRFTAAGAREVSA